MKFEVEMWAFREGEIREVQVPNRQYEEAKEHEGAVLDLIYTYGQNDFQPHPTLPSVSVGDVIRLNGKKYRVRNIGFDIVPDDYNAPKSHTEVAYLPDGE